MRTSDAIDKNLVHLAFLHREECFSHHTYADDMAQYELIRDGDMRSVEYSSSLFCGTKTGHVSNDPLRNKRYLFVAAVTLASRFSMDGGLPQETAYNLSDIFILRMDECRSINEINALHREMMAEFTTRVAEIQKNERYTKTVLLAMDFIYMNLQNPFTVNDIAQKLGVSRSYLSTLFKRETGVSVSDYIRKKRIEAAENMLKYSDFSLQAISNYLAFNSQSHFASVFKSETGLTPGAYRQKHFVRTWHGSDEIK